MNVLLSNSNSRGSQKYEPKSIPRESSQESKANQANIKAGVASQTSKSRMRENSVNTYPPGVGRVTPTNNTQITKGE
jgi:hypothetical protein